VIFFPDKVLAKAFAVLKKDVLTAIRYRSGLVFCLISPAAQLATFYYLSRAVGAQFRPDGMPYFLFLVAGTGFYTFLLAEIHSFLRVVQESQQNGMLEVLMTTSTPPTVLVMLSAMSAFGSGILQLVFYFGAGIAISSVTHVNLFGCIAVFTLSALMAVATGLFAAGVQIAIHKGSAVLWLFGSSAWLLTGTMFPISALPLPVRVISVLLPFTHSLTGMRLALQQAPGGLMHEIELLIGFTICLLPLSIVFFSWTVRRARQLGSLSSY
jgi:ABC-2 type transport system permease protein